MKLFGFGAKAKVSAATPEQVAWGNAANELRAATGSGLLATAEEVIEYVKRLTKLVKEDESSITQLCGHVTRLKSDKAKLEDRVDTLGDIIDGVINALGAPPDFDELYLANTVACLKKSNAELVAMSSTFDKDLGDCRSKLETAESLLKASDAELARERKDMANLRLAIGVEPHASAEFAAKVARSARVLEVGSLKAERTRLQDKLKDAEARLEGYRKAHNELCAEMDLPRSFTAEATKMWVKGAKELNVDLGNRTEALKKELDATQKALAEAKAREQQPQPQQQQQHTDAWRELYSLFDLAPATNPLSAVNVVRHLKANAEADSAEAVKQRKAHDDLHVGVRQALDKVGFYSDGALIDHVRTCYQWNQRLQKDVDTLSKSSAKLDASYTKLHNGLKSALGADKGSMHTDESLVDWVKALKSQAAEDRELFRKKDEQLAEARSRAATPAMESWYKQRDAIRDAIGGGTTATDESIVRNVQALEDARKEWEASFKEERSAKLKALADRDSARLWKNDVLLALALNPGTVTFEASVNVAKGLRQDNTNLRTLCDRQRETVKELQVLESKRAAERDEARDELEKMKSTVIALVQKVVKA